MSYLKLTMNQGTKSAELEIQQSDEKQRNDAVTGLFRFFGDKPVTSTVTTSSAKPYVAPKTNVAPDKVQTASLPPLSAGGVTATPAPHKPAKPPLINSERTLQMPIGEMMGKATADAVSPEPDHYKTGIKYKDGITHYRLRYWCKNPQCKDKAGDYIPADQMVVNCRQCGMALKVRPAAPKGERDSWGNFFIADQPAEGAL